jgi:hypothetical protein
MIAVAVMAAAGWLYTRRLAEGMLVGGILAAAALAALSLVGVSWSPFTLAAALAIFTLPAIRVAAGFSRPAKAGRYALFHLPTAALVAWHVRNALRPELWDWTNWLISRRDFFFIWGYKARLFFTFHGIPWSFLRGLPSDFTHPDYPLLVPLLFDADAVLTNAWHPAWSIVAIDTTLAAALLGIVYKSLRDDFDPLFAAAGTFALTGSALLPWVGFAEGPLVAYGGAAALMLRRGRVGFGIVFLSAAAMAKNEGIALAVAMAIALATTAEGRRILPKLWPVAVVIGGWLAVRSTMPTDLFSGPVLARIGHNLADFPHAFATVPTHQPVVWLVSLIAIVLGTRREGFLLTAAAIQILFYLAAYAITPLDVVGHVNGSWPRLTSHVTIFLAYSGVTSIGTMLKR